MISAGHIERVSESEPSDYENCSSSEESLGTEVGHLPVIPYIMHANCNMQIVDFAKNVDSFLQNLAIESDGCLAATDGLSTVSGLSRHYF